jgi:hypothetical protein
MIPRSKIKELLIKAIDDKKIIKEELNNEMLQELF